MRVDLDRRQCENMFGVLGYVCFSVTLIGIFRYHFGYDVQGSENSEGLAEGVGRYFYMGISYLPSTRNSDVMYFAVAFLVFLAKAVGGTEFKKIYLFFCLVSLYAVLMSLSRGAWIAAFVASMAVVGVAGFFKMVLPVIFSGGVFVAIVYPEISRLFYAGFLSLVSSGAANDMLSGFYKYSNDDRLYIYIQALHDFMNYPFGYGISFIPSYAGVTGAKSVHSENIYLDFLLILGVFSMPLFWAMFRWFRRVTHRPPSEGKKLLLSLGIFLLIFHLFNSGVDFVFAWFVVALLVIAAPAMCASQKSLELCPCESPS